MKSMGENESLLFDFYRKAQIPTSETDSVKKKWHMEEAYVWMNTRNCQCLPVYVMFSEHLLPKLTHKDQIVN